MDHMLLGEGDIEDFRIEKTVKADKSLDEIKQLCVDENLSENDRVFLLLSSSFEVQKVWAVEHVVPLLRRQGNSNLLMKILPKLKSLLKPPISLDIHTSVSHCFTNIANDASLHYVVFSTHFLPTILTELESGGNNARGKVWLNCLEQSAAAVSKDAVKHKILNLIRSKCQLSQPIESRQTSCTLVGSFANKMEPYWVKQELLPLVRTLCQDVDHEVRIRMCRELPKVAQALGPEGVKSYLLCELEELSKDDQIDVRCTALSALYDILPLIDDGTNKERIIPVIIRFLEESVCNRDESDRLNNQMRLYTARLIGRISYDLKDLYSPDNITTLLDTFTDLSHTRIPVSSSQLKSQAQPSTMIDQTTTNGLTQFDPDNTHDTECRRLCAYNIPGMILFSSTANKTDVVLSVLKTLSQDSEWKVRLAVAHGYHEVIKHLGNNSKTLLKDYVQLLQDNEPEVLVGLVKGLPTVLQVWAKAFKLDPKTRQPGLLELIQSLLSAELVSSTHRQWRLHRDYLEAFSELKNCMTSDQLYTHFVPVLWKCVGFNTRKSSTTSNSSAVSTTYALPVKRSAFKTLCSFIPYIRRADQRREICSRFISDCCHSSNYRQRLLFVEVCKLILELFSRNFFKEHGFFTALLSLSKDRIVNVRCSLCSMLPQMKSVILLPVDREYQTLLESAIADLLMDKHSECLIGAKLSVQLMDKINYRMQSMVTYSLEGEVMDKEREDIEKQWLKEEEEYDRDREGSSHRLYPDRKSAPLCRGSGNPQSPATKKRPNLLGGKSPGINKKTNNLGQSPANSPLQSRLNTGKTLSLPTSGSTPDPLKKSYTDQATEATSTASAGGKKNKYSAGSSPNLLSPSGVSPKGVKTSKVKDTTSPTSTKLSSAPTQSRPTATKSGGTGTKKTAK